MCRPEGKERPDIAPGHDQVQWGEPLDSRILSGHDEKKDFCVDCILIGIGYSKKLLGILAYRKVVYCNLFKSGDDPAMEICGRK